jgi:TM2 domain-containing membrane protein YozV
MAVARTSKCIAYMFLFTLGFTGAHLFYVGRYAQALASVHTGGFMLLGFVYDAFNLSRYVDEANCVEGRGECAREPMLACVQL